jgi:NTE family protein
VVKSSRLLLKVVLFSLLVFSNLPARAQPYHNLVLEGGGIRGIAYAGAVKVLEEKKLTQELENIAGTSVGALAGTLLAVGYNAEEMRTLLYDLKIQSFNDGRWIFFGGFHRMLNKFGWYRGDAIERWIEDLIHQKTGTSGLTFLQLHNLHLSDKRYKDLYITAANLTQQRLTVFNWKTYPDMLVSTAVRASISVPLYYNALFLDAKGKKADPKRTQAYDVFVDGGVVANYPLSLFDEPGKPNPHTLGLKLERPEQMEQFKHSRDIAPYRIYNFNSYVSSLYNIILEGMSRDSSFTSEGPRTIYISTGNITPKVRKITSRQKDELYNNGIKGAQLFFHKSAKPRR